MCLIVAFLTKIHGQAVCSCQWVRLDCLFDSTSRAVGQMYFDPSGNEGVCACERGNCCGTELTREHTYRSACFVKVFPLIQQLQESALVLVVLSTRSVGLSENCFKPFIVSLKVMNEALFVVRQQRSWVKQLQNKSNLNNLSTVSVPRLPLTSVLSPQRGMISDLWSFPPPSCLHDRSEELQHLIWMWSRISLVFKL